MHVKGRQTLTNDSSGHEPNIVNSKLFVSFLCSREAGIKWEFSSTYIRSERDSLIDSGHSEAGASYCYHTVVPHVVITILHFILGHRGQISLSVFSSALLQG